MMDAKKIAMVIAITVLLPLFVGLFADAAYKEPKYEDYCNNTYDYGMKAIPATPTNCSYNTDPVEAQCYSNGGQAEFNYTVDGCQKFQSCNYCSKFFNDAQQKYNRNLFFILLPIGLVIVILGLYLIVDYLGAGLMFAGLIVMFYATFRYFSDMSKMLRAIVILIELLVIMWIGYKKIEHKKGPFEKIHENISGNNSGKINKSVNIKKKDKYK
jgi:hypothetical protein